ncbi:FMN-dependent NADH-azoreductase [Vibrio sp. SCSIO 43137]|uniref:FMN-dependent NADH-azoreductase n=1 Tax=Vibrio sp. SCSIO 43137 TaxID=3021011 RepID=UPI00230759EE|nr:FMN-dependent NADH-azoreductase [Vibrio sp. SCSIO 43137]WCE28817.1 FMN-dependent NADH-azoreductase [Vibrio sp. SCSIO 43137]
MSHTLVLKSSILGEHSQSNQLIDQVIEGKENVLVRDLAANPLPVLDMSVMTALNTPEEQRSDEQKSLVELSDTIISELKSADKLVIAAPMYNFMVPTQLKNWFDIIARAGVTFRYTETVPVGLLEDKKVVVVTTRGGLHKDSERNSIESYITSFLGFVGITSVEFVYAEGLNVTEEMAQNAREAALQQLAVAV